MNRAYSSVGKFFVAYWKAYGGWTALLGSPYLHLSVVISAALFGWWGNPGWWTNSISLISSLLGFSLGGFAILLTLGNETFMRVMSAASSPDKTPSKTPLLILSSSFVHFILVQAVAILLALTAESFYKIPAPLWMPWLGADLVRVTYWGISAFATIYAVCCALAATQYIFISAEKLVKIHKLEADARKGQSGRNSP